MKKQNALIELKKLNLPLITEKMTKYATSILRHVDKKSMQGLEPLDFAQQVLLKVCDGTRNWDTAKTDNMEVFLMMNLKSECVNFITKLKRKKVLLTNYDETYTISDDIVYT